MMNRAQERSIAIGAEIETTDGERWIVLDVDSSTRTDISTSPAVWCVSAKDPDADAIVSVDSIRRVR